MSFLFNDENIKNLLASIEAKNQLKKIGQVPPGAPPTLIPPGYYIPPGAPPGTLPQPIPAQPKISTPDEFAPVDMDAYRLAKPLLVNLQRTIDPSSKVSEIASRGSELGTSAAKPDVRNFRTLGDFIRWSSDNKLTWKGKRFSFPSSEPEPARSSGANISIDAMEPGRSRGENLSPNKDTFLVNIPNMIGYLSSIRDNEATIPENKVLEVMIKSNIVELNRILSNAGMQTIPTKSTTLITNQIPDNAIIDGFGSMTVFNPADGKWDEQLGAAPFFPGSGKVLTGKDIKNTGAFQSWLSQFKTLKKQPAPKPGETPKPASEADAVRFDSPYADPCTALFILNKRANNLKSRADGLAQRYDDAKDYPKYIDAYLDAIKKISGVVKDPSGAACAITTPTTLGAGGIPGTGVPGAAGTGAAGTGAAGTGAAGGKIQEANPALLREIVGAFPLRREAVRLYAISEFISLIEKLNNTNLTSKGQQISNLIREASTHPNDGINFNLDLTTSWSRKPTDPSVYENPFLIDMKPVSSGASPVQHFSNYVTTVYQIVDRVGGLIRDFYNTYKTQIDADSTLKHEVVYQAGVNGSGSGTIQYYNLSALSSYKRMHEISYRKADTEAMKASFL